jgi:hypothetical protein
MSVVGSGFKIDQIDHMDADSTPATRGVARHVRIPSGQVQRWITDLR